MTYFYQQPPNDIVYATPWYTILVPSAKNKFKKYIDFYLL